MLLLKTMDRATYSMLSYNLIWSRIHEIDWGTAKGIHDLFTLKMYESTGSSIWVTS